MKSWHQKHYATIPCGVNTWLAPRKWAHKRLFDEAISSKLQDLENKPEGPVFMWNTVVLLSLVRRERRKKERFITSQK